jgi:hypothetical protein
MRTNKIRLPLLSLVIASFMLTGCGLNPFQSQFWENSILANLIQAFTGSVGAPAGSQAKQEGAKSQLVAAQVMGKISQVDNALMGLITNDTIIDSAGAQYYRVEVTNKIKKLDLKLQSGRMEVKGHNLFNILNRTFEYWKFTGTEKNLDTFNGKFGEVCSLSAIVYIDSLDRRLQFWAKVITSAPVDSTDSTEENTLGDSAYVSLDSMENPAAGQYLQNGTAHYYDQDGKVQLGVIKITVDHNGTIGLDDHNGTRDEWRDNKSTMEFDMTNTENGATYHIAVTHYGPENPTAAVTEGRIKESGSANYGDGKKLLEFVKYRWVIGTTQRGDIKSSVTWYDDTAENNKVKTVIRYFDPNKAKDVQDYTSGS